jgi:hypothetical protein
MASTIRYYSNMKTFIIVIKRTSLFLEMIRAHCELFPGSIQPHPYQCAQYFDCGPTIGGSYLRECKYPQLFDEVSMTCQNFFPIIQQHKIYENNRNMWL